MKRLLLLCAICTVMLFGFSPKTEAQTPAYDFTTPGTVKPATTRDLGWSFTPLRPINITSFGMYSHLGTPLE